MSTEEIIQKFNIKEHVQALLQSNTPTPCYYVDGKCSECGQCCSRLLPLSQKDIKVMKRYIKKHTVTYYHKHRTAIDMPEHFNCPFLNGNVEGRCNIYPARPTICRLFSCKDNPHGKLPGAITKYQLLDMYEVFGIEQK